MSGARITLDSATLHSGVYSLYTHCDSPGASTKIVLVRCDQRRRVPLRDVERPRLGRILNPRTGWTVDGAPRSVTVLAPSCIEAGTLSTLARLRGAAARAFLEEQGVRSWVV
jgi:hypothetical protein